MNNHDYFMRQIEDIAQFLTKTFFHKAQEEVPLFDEQGMPLGSGILYGTLKTLVSNGKINEAENMLFDELEKHKDENYLEIAVRFYEALNNLPDEKLEAGNFSREEIYDGLSEVKQICEISGDVDG